ncbi:MAG: hypothetical protein IJJ95_08180 [Spirochaetales bacterium]|nr:hypothetical protein [Spirochaetales bacterium]
MRRLITILFAAVLSLLFIVSCSQDKITLETYNMMYGHISQVWAQSLAHADAKIAFFGDSRVIGADWNAAYPDSKVINLGVGGDKVGNLLARMGQIKTLTESGQLECVFIAIGGNDCMSSKYDSSVFRSEYNTLLSELQALGVTVYVNTVAGITDEGTSVETKTASLVNKRMNEANGIIKELAASYEMQVIDMASLMNNADGRLKKELCTPDGVHFSEAGNNLWFETLRPYVLAVDPGL